MKKKDRGTLESLGVKMQEKAKRLLEETRVGIVGNGKVHAASLTGDNDVSNPKNNKDL